MFYLLTVFVQLETISLRQMRKEEKQPREKSVEKLIDFCFWIGVESSLKDLCLAGVNIYI